MSDYMRKLEEMEERKSLAQKKECKKKEVADYIDKLDKYELDCFTYGVMR